MDRSNKKKNTIILNAQWQIPVPNGSKLHIPPANYHLAAQQEPYKKNI